jgi:5'-phosphate synthase pdxT subunit
LRIGVLALQGDFLEHQKILSKLAVEAPEVRLADELDGLNGLIIPGGESTTIGKLAVDFGLMEPLRNFARSHPVWGTCAGSIFLSKDVRRDQPLLGVMDIQVARNAFGRQVDSFETDITFPVLSELSSDNPPFRAVFIRAPLIEKVGNDALAIGWLPEGAIIAARQGHLLATSFHPELTDDDRFHRYFLEMAS